MPAELRKRKAPPPTPTPVTKKRANGAKGDGKAKEEAKEEAKPATKPATNGGKSPPAKVAVGDVIALDEFGGEVETHDGETTTLKKLVDESDKGIVLFTYPKASTPGCEYSVDWHERANRLTRTAPPGTTQACLFRDEYEGLTATGFSIYGLSTDSPKANSTFRAKQKLPYALLCDPQATLIGAIGLKKAPKGTTRGVFVIDKAGKILAAEPGGPAATVEVVKKLVGGGDAEEKADQATEAEVETEINEAHETDKPAMTAQEIQKDDQAKAEVAAEVADSATLLDG